MRVSKKDRPMSHLYLTLIYSIAVCSLKVRNSYASLSVQSNEESGEVTRRRLADRDDRLSRESMQGMMGIKSLSLLNPSCSGL